MTDPSRLRVLTVPKHTCGQCAACCASFRVGPLTDHDIERLKAAAPAVLAAMDDPPAEFLETDGYRGQTAWFLRKRNGFCVFFEGGCSVHRVAGSEAKPLACRMFPLQITKTDDGLRLGNRATCLSDAAVYRTGDGVPAPIVAAALAESAALPRAEAPAEAALLRVLGLPDVDDPMILSFLAQRPTPDEPPIVEPWLEATLGGMLEEIDSILQDGADQGIALGPTHPDSPTGKDLARFRRWHGARNPERAGTWPPVPPEGVPWLIDAVKRQTFLRQYQSFPGLAWAVLAWLAAARYAAAYVTETGDGFDPARFGRVWAAWTMLLEGPRLQRALVLRPPPFE